MYTFIISTISYSDERLGWRSKKAYQISVNFLCNVIRKIIATKRSNGGTKVGINCIEKFFS